MTERPTQDTDTVHEVSDDSARGVVVDNLRKSLISVKIRSAEDYNDRTRHLLQQCIDLVPIHEQQVIESKLDESVRNPRIPCIYALLKRDSTDWTNWRRTWRTPAPHFKDFF